jgi:hypothetical protein
MRGGTNVDSKRRKRTLLAVMACSVVVVTIGGSVFAGLKVEENVAVTVSGTSATARGAIGTARNSPDSTQFIRCTVQGFVSSNAVFCSARTKAGKNFACVNNDSPSLALAVAGVGTNSRLFIAAENGVCTQIDSTNGSVNKPAVP